ncbi:MAG: glycosyl transferase, partial [Candidatus Atribacteria bacterium]
NYQRNLNIGEVAVDANAIIHFTEYRERRNHFATFSCSEAIAGFDTQRDAFLGPYRGWDRPIAVERGSTSESKSVGGSPIGAHHVRVDLQPGETKSIVFILGYHEDETRTGSRSGLPDLTEARQTIARYMEQDAIDRAMADLNAHWESELSALQIETGEPALDRMINTWNAYQCAITYSVSRSASGYESGIGRGIGFRDANQDLLGCVQLISEKARARLLDLASTQLVSGGAYHQYQPLTRKGNDAIGGDFNDDPLWLIYATAAYLKETGDWDILNDDAGYGDSDDLSESLYDHLLRAANYTLSRLGPHGLPLIGRADWNDCLNLNCHSTNPDEPFQIAPVRDATIAESVFIGALFCLACSDLIEIASRRNDGGSVLRLRDADAAMRSALLTHGWDGQWFLRAYDAEGKKVGSHENDEGQIFIETQGMCPMANIGIEDGRALSALDAVGERLATDHGILLHQPAYTTYNPGLGEISSYPPGYKENGSVFCHTNPWIVISECMLGRADRAWDYAMRINPAAREAISEIHECEPYVYAQTIVGRDAVDHGRARNSWLTGTASWAYVAMTQWILGIRPSFDGLIVDPCLPSALRNCRVVRKFRGATYDIRMTNPSGSTGGVRSIEIDGAPFDGSVLPLFADGVTHTISVILGEKS